MGASWLCTNRVSHQTRKAATKSKPTSRIAMRIKRRRFTGGKLNKLNELKRLNEMLRPRRSRRGVIEMLVRKAAEDCRTPRRFASSKDARNAARFWSAAVLCRFSGQCSRDRHFQSNPPKVP